MTREEQDGKEFEKWWGEEIIESDELNDLKPRWYYAKLSWLASRRLMREQLGKWHDIDEFYKEKEDKDG